MCFLPSVSFWRNTCLDLLAIFLKELIYFGCAGLSCCSGFSLLAGSRGSSPVVGAPLAVTSYCGARALECAVSSLRFPGSEHGLSSCAQPELLQGVCVRPRPGISPAFPALAGGFFTTKPLGKHSAHFDWIAFLLLSAMGCL